MKALLNIVKLVYPPISNQEAEWLFEVPAVREFVKKSKLYMLAQRHEVLFKNYSINKIDEIFCFDLVCGSDGISKLQIEINNLIRHYSGPPKELIIDLGERSIKIYHEDNLEGEPIYWATTDKLLYDFWRKRITISGLNSVRPFTKYDLYYVGISKENDSFSRLFESGHKNRLKILSNETQYTPTARLTDEIYIFLFDIEHLESKTIEDANDFNPLNIDKTKLIADAEKAFVHILESKYNKVKYKRYPAGTDGLSNFGLNRYGYIIDEDVTFNTKKGELRGVHDSILNPEGHQEPDIVFICGDNVEILRPPKPKHI
jgi:hypothetical protein